MIIDGEHAISIAKVLWMVYNNFNLFAGNIIDFIHTLLIDIFLVDVKHFLCEYLLNDVFFKLFLHWSWSVRNMFHYLLLFRIYHQHKKRLANMSSLAY